MGNAGILPSTVAICLVELLVKPAIAQSQAVNSKPKTPNLMPQAEHPEFPNPTSQPQECDAPVRRLSG